MSSKVTVLGHRGASGLPENTIPSFERALEQGADGFELDVRQTGDGQLAVVHASVVGNHSVQASPYDAIRDLGDGYYVPLFEEVLEKFAKRAYLDIEFKSPGFEAQATEIMRKHVDPANTMVCAFDPNTLIRVQELFPELKLGFIYNRTQDEESRHNGPVDVVIPQFRLASRELIDEVHDEDLQVFAWTVNDAEEMRRLLRLGIDGFITDEPALCRSVIADFSS